MTAKGPLWLRMVGTALDATHPEAGAVWMIEDITDRRLAEKLCAMPMMCWKARVLERTKELESVVIQLQQEVSERIRAERNVWEIAHHDEN